VGVEIVLLAARPELARGIYDLAAEALSDVPGADDWLPPPFERFVAAHLHAAAIFVAVADGEVIGYAKLTARADGRTADHGMTAVRRDWRNHGVATALKLAQIAWAKEAGFERLTASNEERNAPMQHINSLLGYRLIPGRVRLRAPVRRTSLR
jgi:GNAT superfamily N-acetyltransferase